MLRGILENSGIDSVVKYGKINLEALQQELGFGLLDGLYMLNKKQTQNEKKTHFNTIFNAYDNSHN